MEDTSAVYAQTEHALRAGEAQLALALRAAKMVMYEWDLVTDLVTVNARFREISAPADATPFRGSQWLATMTHPDSRAAMDAAFGRAFAPDSDGQFEFAFPMTAPNGADLWVLTTGHASFVGEGAERRAVRVYGTGIDITAQKTTEAASRASEARQRGTLDMAELGIWTWNLVTNEGFLDERGAALLGLAPGYLADMFAVQRTCIHPDDLIRVDAEVAAGIAAGATFSMSYRVTHPDGSVYQLVSQARVVTDAAGRPVQLIGTTRDVTVEPAMSAATAADAVPQVIWANTADGIANYFNERWFTYSGLTFEESFGRSWQAIVHPDDAPASVDRWQRALAAGAMFDTEYRLRRADGAYRWHLGRTVPVCDEDGHITGWFGSATDIEDLKQAEAAVQRAHDVLEQRIAARTTELAAVNTALQQAISERRQIEAECTALLQHVITAQDDERRRIAREVHDQMGQTVTALMLAMKTLRDAAQDDSALAPRLTQLHGLGTQLGHEVRTLALKLRPPALPTLATYLAHWSTQTGIMAELQSIGLNDDHVPSSIETTLFRVVKEALTNVERHAQATQVSVIVQRQAEALLLIVEDNGVGLDATALRHIPAAARRPGLMGMRERVEQADGTLHIESSPGQGSTIFVTIPLRSPTDQGRSYTPV